MPGRELKATKSVTLEPNWDGMRRWVVEAVYPSDPAKAREIAEAMGCEAPELPEED
jgi:hypothetical protein